MTIRTLLSVLLLATALYAGPATAQETSGGFSGGSVMLGYDNRTCNSGLSGSIRYNSSTSCTEFCDGTAWSCPAGVKTSSCTVTVTSGLISRWPFDEKSGVIANDIHGAQHLRMASNVVWQPTGGRIGGAAQFTGAGGGNYRALSNSETHVDLDQFSVCMWYNTPGSDIDMFTSNFGRWRGFGFPDAASDDVFVHIDLATTDLSITTNPVFTTNAWNHMCVTYNGTLTATTAVQVYRNGAVVTKNWTQNGVGDTTASNDGFLALGADATYVGYLDDTLVYNRALTAGEVTTIYNNYTACP